MDSMESRFAEAVARHQSGDLPEAAHRYQEILQEEPTHAGALSNLGVILAKTNPEEAVRLYAAAIAANPKQLDAQFNLGNLCRKLNRPRDAVNAYQAALRIDPNNARIYLNLGLAAEEVGDLANAIECFRRAVGIDPNFPDAYNLLGDVLYRLALTDEAITVFREFIDRFPDDPRARHNLGLALAGKADYEAAVPELERALQLRPNYPDAHNSLGVALEALGRSDEAREHYRRAAELRPEYADAWSNLGTSYTEQGRVTEAITALRKSLEFRDDSRTADNLLLARSYSSNVTPEELRDEHIAWAQKYAKVEAVPPRRIASDLNRRQKIGYVSGDFRTHTVSGFIELLLTHHDRNRFHVSCYPTTGQSDDVTDRLRRLADSWRPASTLSDSRLAETILIDEIDVLVDLSGHTAGNRLTLFARKPAAIQVTLFGYPATTGVKAIDYRITDAFADPPGETESLCVEKLLRLPEVAWAYRPPADAPVPNDLPSKNRSTFTFGSLNNPAKLSDACIEAWAAVLKAVPKSRLVLLSGRSQEAARLIVERFTQLGVASDRLELVLRLPTNEYFEAYQPIDLALDPFPFNGGVTTCDALWMGVPVLTVAGRDYRSRQGVSLLNNLGLPEFVADTPQRLVDLAATWSEQRDALADLRSSLRDMMLASPITQAKQYVRNLEATLRKAWMTSLGES